MPAYGDHLEETVRQARRAQHAINEVISNAAKIRDQETGGGRCTWSYSDTDGHVWRCVLFAVHGSYNPGAGREVITSHVYEPDIYPGVDHD